MNALVRGIAAEPSSLSSTVTGKRGRGIDRKDGHPASSGNPVDIHVGKRVRLRRTLLGMSQEKLGEAIGLTFQQVQKYERGFNRISASKLYHLAQVLDVPVSFFFDDMPAEVANGVGSGGNALQVDDSMDALDASLTGYQPDPLAKRETLELVRAYYRIKSPVTRKRLFELTKAMGGTSDDTAGTDGAKED